MLTMRASCIADSGSMDSTTSGWAAGEGVVVERHKPNVQCEHPNIAQQVCLGAATFASLPCHPLVPQGAGTTLP